VGAKAGDGRAGRGAGSAHCAVTQHRPQPLRGQCTAGFTGAKVSSETSGIPVGCSALRSRHPQCGRVLDQGAKQLPCAVTSTVLPAGPR
jgi:hypothetical protein